MCRSRPLGSWVQRSRSQCCSDSESGMILTLAGAPCPVPPLAAADSEHVTEHHHSEQQAVRLHPSHLRVRLCAAPALKRHVTFNGAREDCQW
eukprot:1947157-Rhodomonas_salina.3